MKGIDVLVVRMLPFILFVISVACSIYSCFNQCERCFYYLHGNSVIYASALFLISLANKRYHCIWNRAMYLFLIIVPIINYIDAKYNIFPSSGFAVLFVIVSTILTAIITAYLAIKHFITLSKRKLKDGNDQQQRTEV